MKIYFCHLYYVIQLEALKTTLLWKLSTLKAADSHEFWLVAMHKKINYELKRKREKISFINIILMSFYVHLTNILFVNLRRIINISNGCPDAWAFSLYIYCCWNIFERRMYTLLSLGENPDKKTIGRKYHWEVRKLKEGAYISQPVVLKWMMLKHWFSWYHQI